MNWQTSLYVFALVLASALAASLAWVAWQRRSTPGSKSFTWMMLAVAEWSLTVAIELSAVGLENKIFWSKLQYLGAAPLATFFLFFTCEYARKDAWLTRRNRLLLLVVPMVSIGMAATNEWHSLVWTSFTPGPEGSNLVVYGHGAGFFLSIAYYYLTNLAATVVLVWAVFRFPQLYRHQASLVLAAAIIPWAGSILYVNGLSPVPGLDPAPLAFSLTGVILAWSLFRFRLLDIVPVARDTVVENMKDGVLVLDTNNRVADINPAAQQLLGLNSSSAIGKDASVLFKTWNDIRPSSVQQLDAMLRLDRDANLTLVVGKVAPHFIDVYINLIRDTNGLISGRMVILRDLTEARQVQEEIHRLKEFNESIVQSVSEGIIIEDLDGRFIFINPAVTELLGYDSQELLGNHWSLLVAPEHQHLVEDANRRRKAGSSERYELELIHRDGHRVPVLVSARPQYDSSSGEASGSLAVFTDLSGLIKAEKELADTKALLEAAFEQTPIPMVLASTPDRVLRMVNTACREYLGIQGEPDYVGRVVDEMNQTWRDIDPNGKPILASDLPFTQALEGKISRDVELGVLRKDGSLGWELVNAGPVYNRAGEQIAALVVFPDITERKRVEQAEREQRIMAEALRDSADALNSTLNLDEVLDRILENIGRVVPHDAAYVALINESGEPNVARSRGYTDGRMQELELSVRMRLSDLSGLHETNAGGDDPAEEYVEFPLPSRARSSVSAPVHYRGKMIGLLNLDSATPDYFTRAHIDRLRAFADQAAVAIENARLFAETSRRAEQLDTLNRIGLAITSGLDMERVLQELFEQCQQVFDIDVFYIASFNQEEGVIRFALYVEDGMVQKMGPSPLVLQPGLAGTVIQRRKTLYLPDVTALDGEQEDLFAGAAEDQARSYMGAPLLLGDGVLGVLAIQNRRPSIYSSEEVRLLETIATQAAIAIENARLFQQMEQLAIIDGLTGLYNRRHFFLQAAIEVERAARYNKPLSAIMMDLDHFKNVNDTYGHKAGDQVLQAIADVCSQALRKVDIIGRYGGEEFAIILPETTVESAQIVGERLRTRISELMVPSPAGDIKITACLGLASLENSSANVDMLLDCADQALYAAKQGGRNQVRIFRGGLQSNLVLPFDR